MKCRDLTILPMTDELDLVIACDVAAAIGEKVNDALSVPVAMVGASCVRVSLLELLALGAEPFCVSHLAGNEFEPTGRASLAGIQEELAKAGYAHLEINGSTEENMKTTMTSVGVTLLGTIAKNGYDLMPLRDGDVLYRLGKPLVGQAVLERSNEMVTYDEVKALRAHRGVKDMLPVGSKGMGYEIGEMSHASHLLCKVEERWLYSEDWYASSGPATSVLVGVDQAGEMDFTVDFPKAEYIGQFNRLVE